AVLVLFPWWSPRRPASDTPPPVKAKVVRSLEGWGELTDPDGDCTIGADRGKLTITVPGTPHNLTGPAGNTSAPRILRPVTGDFPAQVKVTGDFQPGHPKGFNGAGLLLWADNANYVRLERNVWLDDKGRSLCYPPLFEYWNAGRHGEQPGGTFEPFFKGRS